MSFMPRWDSYGRLFTEKRRNKLRQFKRYLSNVEEYSNRNERLYKCKSFKSMTTEEIAEMKKLYEPPRIR